MARRERRGKRLGAVFPGRGSRSRRRASSRRSRRHDRRRPARRPPALPGARLGSASELDDSRKRVEHRQPAIEIGVPGPERRNSPAAPRATPRAPLSVRARDRRRTGRSARPDVAPGLSMPLRPKAPGRFSSRNLKAVPTTGASADDTERGAQLRGDLRVRSGLETARSSVRCRRP